MAQMIMQCINAGRAGPGDHFLHGVATPFGWDDADPGHWHD
jgi:hypothetical protein